MVLFREAFWNQHIICPGADRRMCTASVPQPDVDARVSLRDHSL